MKALLLLLVGVLSSGCVLAEPAASRFTVRVMDAETSLPVTNAMVQTIFEHQYDPWGNKPSIVDRRKEPVDLNGEVIFKGKCIHGGAGGTVFAEGYYSSHAGKSTKKNLILNRWEPWNPTIEVRMRPKKNLVPMIHFQHKTNWIKMPEKDKSIGFDLERADWLAPHGKGKIADFIFHPYRIDTDEEIRFGYKLTFSNPMDGIQEYYVSSEDMRSSYLFPYLAPTNGYVSSMEKIKIDPHYGRVETDMNKKNNYIFRVRSHEDENGNIIGCYGRISGEITMSGQFGLQFGYWFNPIPNERSLEYSGENLLKK